MSEKKYDAKLEQVKGNLKKGFGKVTGTRNRRSCRKDYRQRKRISQ